MIRTRNWLKSAIILVLLLPPSTLAAQIGTITLEDGTVYENVTFTVNKLYKVLEFEFDGKKKAVSFTDVETIVNQNGADMTERVLGEYHDVESKQVSMTENDRAYKQEQRKLWSVGFSLGGSFGIPAGDYYEGINSGLGFGGDFVVALTHNIALRASVSRSGLKADDNLVDIWPVSPSSYFLYRNYKFHSTNCFLSFEYYNRPDSETPGKVMFHLLSGLGFVIHKTEADEVYVVDGFVISATPVSYSETKFATTVGGIITHMFDRSIGVYAGANMNVIWLGKEEDADYDYWDNDIVYAFQFDLRAGITFLTK